MRGKIAASSIIALLVLAVAGTPALSAPPDGLETYDAGASTTAFSLGLADQVIAGGLTLAGLTSEGPVSLADGSALLLAGTPQGEAASAAPEGPADAEDCAVDIEEQLPSPIDTAGLQIGCVRTTAPDTEHSTSASESTTIGVLGSGLSQQISDAVLAPLTEGLAPVFEGLDENLLGPLCEGLGGLIGPDCNSTNVVDQVVEGLANPDGTVVSVAIAPGGSETSADDTDGVVAHALSNGVVIKILPNEVLYGTDELGEPNGAVTIRVAPSEAIATADPVTGEITTDASVGLVTAEAGQVGANALGDLLGLDSQDSLLQQVLGGVNEAIAGLAEANEGALACGNDNPLEPIICLDAARAQTDLDQAAIAAINPELDLGEGTTGAAATALGVRLLSAAQEGGLVNLFLAQSVAAVNATPAQEPPPTAPPTTERGPLPRTGSSNTPLLAIGAALVGATMVIRLRRLALKR